jgi:signal transduction histidine kinase
LEFDLADNLPDVKALPSELNQVFLNLVVNASDAIASKVGEDSNEKGLITLRTYSEAGYVVIAVEDTGCGISEEIRHRVYDPFFTTKEVGKGTGQGLAISHDIVVNKHGGKLDMQSTPGVGTTFFIRLPSVPHPESQESTFENELKDLLLV